MTLITKSRMKMTALILSLLSFDFITKYLATKSLPLYSEQSIIPMTKVTDDIYLLLVHHYKDMGLFGSSSNVGLVFMVLLGFYFLYGAFNFPHKYQRIAFAIYLGGYGNILEISYHDYATDFLYFKPLESLTGKTYIFNCADMIVNISISVFIIGLVCTYGQKLINYIRTNKNLDNSV